MATTHKIQAVLDGDRLAIRAFASRPFGPEGKERQAVIHVDIGFDPSKPAPQVKPISNPDMAETDKRMREKAILPTQIDVPPEVAEPVRKALADLQKALAPQLDRLGRKAAAVLNQDHEHRGVFEDADKEE